MKRRIIEGDTGYSFIFVKPKFLVENLGQLASVFQI